MALLSSLVSFLVLLANGVTGLALVAIPGLLWGHLYNWKLPELVFRQEDDDDDKSSTSSKSSASSSSSSAASEQNGEDVESLLENLPSGVLGFLLAFSLYLSLSGLSLLLQSFGVILFGGTSELPFAGSWFGMTLSFLSSTLTAALAATTAIYVHWMLPHVTQRYRDTVKRMQELALESEESRRKMMTFMSFLCHEIRNPLFCITSNLTFLQDEPLSLAQQQTVAAVNQAASLMLRLVNDVLEISRLERGKLYLDHQDFDLREMLQLIAANASTEIQKRHYNPQHNSSHSRRQRYGYGSTTNSNGDLTNPQQQLSLVAFDFELADNVPRWVCSDSVRLLQIVYNLLSNANKFTTQGKIVFSVSALDLSAKESQEHLQLLERVMRQDEDDSDSSDNDDHSDVTTEDYFYDNGGSGDFDPDASHTRLDEEDVIDDLDECDEEGETDSDAEKNFQEAAHASTLRMRNGGGARGGMLMSSTSEINLGASIEEGGEDEASGAAADSSNSTTTGEDADGFDQEEQIGMGPQSQQQQQRSGPKRHSVAAATPLLRQHEVVVLKIQVSDTGPGIPPDRLERLYVPFSQCKLSDYRKHGGTGLGLSVVSKLVQALGGSIQTQSAVGEGSTFTVHLPVMLSKALTADATLAAMHATTAAEGGAMAANISGEVMLAAGASASSRLNHYETPAPEMAQEAAIILQENLDSLRFPLLSENYYDDGDDMMYGGDQDGVIVTARRRSLSGSSVFSTSRQGSVTGMSTAGMSRASRHSRRRGSMWSTASSKRRGSMASQYSQQRRGSVTSTHSTASSARHSRGGNYRRRTMQLGSRNTSAGTIGGRQRPATTGTARRRGSLPGASRRGSLTGGTSPSSGGAASGGTNNGGHPHPAAGVVRRRGSIENKQQSAPEILTGHYNALKQQQLQRKLQQQQQVDERQQPYSSREPSITDMFAPASREPSITDLFAGGLSMSSTSSLLTCITPEENEDEPGRMDDRYQNGRSINRLGSRTRSPRNTGGNRTKKKSSSSQLWPASVITTTSPPGRRKTSDSTNQPTTGGTPESTSEHSHARLRNETITTAFNMSTSSISFGGTSASGVSASGTEVFALSTCSVNTDTPEKETTPLLAREKEKNALAGRLNGSHHSGAAAARASNSQGGVTQRDSRYPVAAPVTAAITGDIISAPSAESSDSSPPSKEGCPVEEGEVTPTSAPAPSLFSALSDEKPAAPSLFSSLDNERSQAKAGKLAATRRSSALSDEKPAAPNEKPQTKAEKLAATRRSSALSHEEPAAPSLLSSLDNEKSQTKAGKLAATRRSSSSAIPLASLPLTPTKKAQRHSSTGSAQNSLVASPMPSKPLAGEPANPLFIPMSMASPMPLLGNGENGVGRSLRGSMGRSSLASSTSSVENTEKDKKLFEGKLVLVVDDNAMNRKLLCRMLKFYSIESCAAEDGKKAVDLVLEHENGYDDKKPFGLIVMDLQMPVMDGIEATRVLRQEHGCVLPIIALTANAAEFNQQQAMEAGATEFCTKPILRHALYEKCKQYMLPTLSSSSSLSITGGDERTASTTKMKNPATMPPLPFVDTAPAPKTPKRSSKAGVAAGTTAASSPAAATGSGASMPSPKLRRPGCNDNQ